MKVPATVRINNLPTVWNFSEDAKTDLARISQDPAFLAELSPVMVPLWMGAHREPISLKALDRFVGQAERAFQRALGFMECKSSPEAYLKTDLEHFLGPSSRELTERLRQDLKTFVEDIRRARELHHRHWATVSKDVELPTAILMLSGVFPRHGLKVSSSRNGDFFCCLEILMDEAEMNETESKPLDPDTLQKLIRQTLAGKQAS